MMDNPEGRSAIRNALAVAAAAHATVRSAAVVTGEMKRGLGSLASIAATASWVGLTGTVIGINNSFGGVDGGKESIMAVAFEGLSKALMPGALGLLVAIFANWCYKFLLTEVESIDLEMESETLQLINRLADLSEFPPTIRLC